jgi:hypothetical protein
VSSSAGEPYVLITRFKDTPVKGQIEIEKHGLQLVRFDDKLYGNDEDLKYFEPVYEDLPLAGVTFNVYAAESVDGMDGTHWYDKDQLVETITLERLSNTQFKNKTTTYEYTFGTDGTVTNTTTSTGESENSGKYVSSRLPLGKYYFKEVAAPDGYTYSDEPVYVELAYKDDKTATVVEHFNIENTLLKAQISLNKEAIDIEHTELENGDVRPDLVNIAGTGFVFGLFNVNALTALEGNVPANTCIAMGRTGEDGKLVFDCYIPMGQYIAKEVKSLDGWLLNSSEHPVSIISSNTTDDKTIQTGVEETIVNDRDYQLLTIVKYDHKQNHPVPGARIEVVDAEGKVVFRGKTDEKGRILDIPLTAP